MTFSRSARLDRRRRVIRESAVGQPTFGSEPPRRNQRRRADTSEDDVAVSASRRDAGYSQDVRRACQQRLTQLIPIRRSSLIFVITTGWLIWGLLIAFHYLIHVRVQSWSQLPIASLFHIRNRDSIAHWLGTQMWMLTALTALMVFQVRRHKLDDYRAKYRIWLVLVFAAIACSLDASSSALYRLGWSIDTWARAEIGYSGWAVVFVSFASLVAIIALRLCTELQSSPMSVVFWLAGLVGWGMGAILGTGLIRTGLPPAQLDMLVGAAWLGGIFSVWMSAGIFLRHVYIQAQRRFVLRERLVRESTSMRLPSLKWPSRAAKLDDQEQDEASGDEQPRKSWFRMPSFRRAELDKMSDEDVKTSKKSNAKKAKREDVNEHDADGSEDDSVDSRSASSRSYDSKSDAKSAQKSASRQSESIDDEYEEDEEDSQKTKSTQSDAKSAGKKSSWSPWGGKSKASDQAQQPSDTSAAKANATSARDAQVKSNKPIEKSKSSDDDSAPTSPKASWWKRSKQTTDADAGQDGTVASSQATTKTKPAKEPKNIDGQSTGLKQRLAFWKKQKVETPVAKSESGSESKSAEKPASEKSSRGLGNWMSKRPDANDAKSEAGSSSAKPMTAKETTAKDASAKGSFWSKKNKEKQPAQDGGEEKPAKKRLFGMFDGLKLKPPVDADTAKQKPGPVPVKTNQSLPTTAANNQDDDDEDDGDRSMTRAEKRRLRREQAQNRRAG